MEVRVTLPSCLEAWFKVGPWTVEYKGHFLGAALCPWALEGNSPHNVQSCRPSYLHCCHSSVPPLKCQVSGKLHNGTMS